MLYLNEQGVTVKGPKMSLEEMDYRVEKCQEKILQTRRMAQCMVDIIDRGK